MAIQEWSPEGYQVTEDDAAGGVGDLAKKMGTDVDSFLKANPGQNVVPPAGTMLLKPVEQAINKAYEFTGLDETFDLTQNIVNRIGRATGMYKPEANVGELDRFRRVQQTPDYATIGIQEAKDREQGAGLISYGESQALRANSSRKAAEGLLGKFNAAYERSAYTGELDLSGVGVITISDMQNYNRIYGTDANGAPLMNAQTLMAQGFTYDGAGNWLPPGGAGGAGSTRAGGGSGFDPNQRFSVYSHGQGNVTRSGRKRYWKRKANGKFELKRVSSRSEYARRAQKRYRNQRKRWAAQQAERNAANLANQGAGSDVNSLALAVGSG